MSIRIITIEREYGSGGAAIAQKLAARLGWKLWDQELTAKIATEAHVPTKAAERCDERVDPLLYRLFKVYARGSYERALPLEGESKIFDADCMVEMLRAVIEDVAAHGNSVIVGRGGTYLLRHRADVAHFFIYAPVDEKIRRLKEMGKPEAEAKTLITEIDRDRAAFIHHYFHAEWPNRGLYNMMINSKFGDDYVVDSILQHVSNLETHGSVPAARTVNS